MLIGVPVAATPGLGPHDDVLVLTLAAELEVALLVALVAALELVLLLVLLLLLLLPQPASTITPTRARSATKAPRRTRVASWSLLTDLSSS
jgi:hypothetical protein